ncbi:hypothetical protein R6G92_001275 [Vibrio cholerae]|nr:hypothetical protein [Vibrio cholerae]EGR1139378.1 hypothetical protein [Vibrio cholerae]EGR2514905.1 hypothetical protein [Vibrio cholerae]ELN6872218.1 hypothetical protein [Vibrio cholerae]ELS8903673.1 hypothetical protein [Vibrio cholerae]
MTKQEIFKAAHDMARGTAKAVGNYMVAFKLALAEVYYHLKNGKGELAPADRSNRFARRTYLPVFFGAERISDYIKQNSRVVRVFTSLSAYNEMFSAGKVGKFWIDANVDGFLAYEYF